jgi:hypothetical protein
MVPLNHVLGVEQVGENTAEWSFDAATDSVGAMPGLLINGVDGTVIGGVGGTVLTVLYLEPSLSGLPWSCSQSANQVIFTNGYDLATGSGTVP